MADILLSVGLQTGKLDTSSLEGEISNAISGLSKKDYKVQIGVEVSANAIAAFRQQLTQMVRSVSLDKGSPIKIDIADIGTITAMAGKFDDVSRAAASASKSVDTLRQKSADVHLNIGSKEFNEAERQINRAIAQLEKLKTSGNEKLMPGLTKEIDAALAKIKDIQGALHDVSRESPMTKLEFEADFAPARAQVDNMVSAVERLRAETKNVTLDVSVTGKEDLERVQTTINNTIKSLQKYTTTDYTVLNADYVSTIQQGINELRTLESQAQSGVVPLNEVTAAIQRIASTTGVAVSGLQRMAEEAKHGADNGKFSIDQYNQAFAQTNNLLTQVQAHLKAWTAAKHGVSASDYESLERYAAALRELINDLPNLKPEEFARRFQEISSGVKQAESSIKAFGQNTQSVLGKMMGMPGKILQAFGISRVLMTAVRAMRDMIDSAIDLDSAMTQLQIVTGATDSEMTQFLSKATGLAKELGVSISDVAKSIEVFSRLGYNLEEASTLSEYATVLSNVAAVGTDEATTGMTSIIKGFDMQVSEAEHVADVLVEVGQKYAVSASEIMEAFEKSGAALNATNTSFEKSAGLIAAANAAVQNASTVGTALKTVSARIRSSKTDLESLGEDASDLAEGFSKYAEEIKNLSGVDIMVEGTTNTFKDIYDIFYEISKVWDQLSDTQQARVSEILGGTRQLQVISSILANFDDAANAYSDAMNSAGVATKANDQYMESVAGHIGQLKAALQELGAQTFTRDAMNQVVDLGIAFVELLGPIAQVISQVGVLQTALLALGAGSWIKSSDGIVKAFGNSIEFAHDGCESIAA